MKLISTLVNPIPKSSMSLRSSSIKIEKKRRNFHENNPMIKVKSKPTSNYSLRKNKRKLWLNDSSTKLSETKVEPAVTNPIKQNLNQTKELVIQIEPIPYFWLRMMTGKSEEKDRNFQSEKSIEILNSPIFKRKTNSEKNFDAKSGRIAQRSKPENVRSRRKALKGKYRCSCDFQLNLIDFNEGKNPKNPERKRKISRSPIFVRSRNERLGKFFPSRCEICSFRRKAISLVNLNNETFSSCSKFRSTIQNENLDENRSEFSISPTEHEQNSKKRQRKRNFQIENIFQKYFPSIKIFVQEEFCTNYPANVQRCCDCQNRENSRQSRRSAPCRFQNCRKLKFFGENQYETAGFTTFVDQIDRNVDDSSDRFDSREKNLLKKVDGEYLLQNLSEIFGELIYHEENVRSSRGKSEIIWKRSVPGWREICDQCSTTLFNLHFFCRECGFILCAECFDESNKNSAEKRKKYRKMCLHTDFYSLAEILPWKILIKLKNDSLKFTSLLNERTSSNFVQILREKRAKKLENFDEFRLKFESEFSSSVEFYCDGRLPVFNESTSSFSKTFFRKVWKESSPVLVKNIHKLLSKSLWQPSSFKEHMIDHHETPALWDCETLTPISTNQKVLTQFWDGFERLDVRLIDEENGGRPRILKLKDWPTKRDFASVFPSRLHDLMTNIPFGDYTRRSYVYNEVMHHGGSMNIVERLPLSSVRPDLGPKLYIAYSQLKSAASRKAGTTNLHIDVSDAVNVLVYVGIGGYGENGSDKTEEQQQVKNEILKSKLDDLQIQRLKNGELPGALWHLFRSDDAEKIREFIGQKNRKSSNSDFIHDQNFYLEQEDLDELKQLYNVSSYSIIQFLGDAIFIPSGAPHQVKNLHSCIKIAEDFVSPENLDRCLITTDEFRFLSKSHTNHGDILQAKNILFNTMRDAFDSLSETIFVRSNSTEENEFGLSS